jgi:hypothetical protein
MRGAVESEPLGVACCDPCFYVWQRGRRLIVGEPRPS